MCLLGAASSRSLSSAWSRSSAHDLELCSRGGRGGLGCGCRGRGRSSGASVACPSSLSQSSSHSDCCRGRCRSHRRCHNRCRKRGQGRGWQRIRLGGTALAAAAGAAAVVVVTVGCGQLRGAQVSRRRVLWLVHPHSPSSGAGGACPSLSLSLAAHMALLSLSSSW
ncbi:hypothetical protein EDB85DRAFT_1963797 [Lactarius pseudohatsudake]|nr:hypothetical protein EDB85DRAFT_1963797 [Lactarius pseudohatsudake]